MLQLPLSESYMETDKLKASMPLQHACWQFCQQRSLLHFSCFLLQHPPLPEVQRIQHRELMGQTWKLKRESMTDWKCQGLPVLLSPSPSMSWQMAEGKHKCYAGRDHRTKCETALESAVKKRVFLQSLQAFTHMLPHFFHRHRYWEEHTLNNLQRCRLFRNVDLCFDLQIFLNLLVAGLLEIAHI